MKNKKELILNTMEELMKEGKAGTASVQYIADRAGIAKGGLYYYFKSKEEIMDEVVNRQYKNIIDNVRNTLAKSQDNANKKLALLFYTYKSSAVDHTIDEYLHLPQNAALHQKSLAAILLQLKTLVADIIRQGNAEKLYHAQYPDEYAEIILSAFTFLHDPGIFIWTNEEMERKMNALAVLLNTLLGEGAGDFLI